MISFSAANRKLAIAANILALVAASLAPALLTTNTAQAAQLSRRSIRMSSSKVSQSNVTYFVTMRVTQATVIKGLVVEICQNSPLIGATCNTVNGVSSTPTTGTVTFTNAGSTGDATFDVHANSTNTGRLILTDSDGVTGGDGFTPATGADMTFSFTATNPSGTSSTSGAPGTFYARILTYAAADGVAANSTGADDYTSTAPNTHLDDGGVALSTARQLTVNARVQEQLEFCVAALDGTIDTNAEAPANCAAFPNTTTVDIGVVDSTTPSVSPVSGTNGGNDKNGAVMIRTNAVNGATVSYFAEQESSSGKLKVAGQTCTDNSSTVDQCFNSAGATQVDFATGAAGERFGMTAGKVLRPTSSTTTNLTRDTDYDGNGTATATNCVAGTIDSASCFAWVDTGTNNPAEPLATSTTVLDYEMLVLNFAARAAATTPTGAYSVTSTYIATSLF